MIRTPQTERAFAGTPAPHVDRDAPHDARGWCHPLDGLRGSGVADRFCAWSGRSGRRYIFSVVPLAADDAVDDLPLAPGAVMLAVRRARTGPRRVLWVLPVEDDRTLATARLALRSLAAAGDAELHLHLLATRAADRCAIVGDLDVPRLAMDAA